MKIVANRGKATNTIPIVLNPVQVQVTLRTVPVEVRDIEVAVQVLPHGANVQNIFHVTIPRVLPGLNRIWNL